MCPDYVKVEFYCGKTEGGTGGEMRFPTLKRRVCMDGESVPEKRVMASPSIQWPMRRDPSARPATTDKKRPTLKVMATSMSAKSSVAITSVYAQRTALRKMTLKGYVPRLITACLYHCDSTRVRQPWQQRPRP